MNEVIFEEKAIDGLMRGMEITHRLVSKTIGACGRNTLYRSLYSRSPVVTNDGYTLARLIHLKDELEAMGADLLKQVASRQNEQCGDGTSTVIVLAYAMIVAGFTLIEQGKDPMSLSKEIIKSSEKIAEMIKMKSKQIESDEDIFNVANISMENPEAAKIVFEAVKKVGKYGTVLVEESNGTTIEREDIDGIKFDNGFLSYFMMTNPSTQQAVLEDCLILVTDKLFSVNSDFFPLLENINARGIKQLLVICDNMVGEVLASMADNKKLLYESLQKHQTDKEGRLILQGFNCVVVQKPNDLETLHDIATFCGAEPVLNENVPTALSDKHFTSLGKAKKIIVSKDSTLIIGGSGDKKKVEDRIESIKEQMANKTLFLKDKLVQRMANLAGSIVKLKVGAPTEADMKYLKLKIDDAVGSTKAAMEEGIVIGGGKTLFEISQGYRETDGDDVVMFACGEPFRKILENAGIKPNHIIYGKHWWNKRIPGFNNGISDGEVYDVLKNEYSNDPFKDGIIDPAKVERMAVLSAANLAAKVITLKDVIIDLPVVSNIE